MASRLSFGQERAKNHHLRPRRKRPRYADLRTDRTRGHARRNPRTPTTRSTFLPRNTSRVVDYRRDTMSHDPGKKDKEPRNHRERVRRGDTRTRRKPRGYEQPNAGSSRPSGERRTQDTQRSDTTRTNERRDDRRDDRRTDDRR